MNCKNNYKKVNRYLANEMDREERLSYETHLQACPLCRAEVKKAELLDSIMQSTPDVEAPDYLSVRIMAEARAMDEKTRRGFNLKFITYGAAVALSLYLGIFTAFWSTASIGATDVSALDTVENTFLYSSMLGD